MHCGLRGNPQFAKLTHSTAHSAAALTAAQLTEFLPLWSTIWHVREPDLLLLDGPKDGVRYLSHFLLFIYK